MTQNQNQGGQHSRVAASRSPASRSRSPDRAGNRAASRTPARVASRILGRAADSASPEKTGPPAAQNPDLARGFFLASSPGARSDRRPGTMRRPCVNPVAPGFSPVVPRIVLKANTA
jgi:hypothetical protein